MFESIFSTASDTTAAVATITWQGVCATIGVALFLGLFVSFIYMITHKKGVYSQSFVLTLVMLPIIISLIIMLVGSNIARAFSLAGAFSIIRFRSTMGDPKDIAYVFFTMAVGLALGVGFIGYGILFAIALCFIMLVLSKINYGSKKDIPKTFKIMLPENMDYEGVFDDIFDRYTLTHDIKRVRTADLGSLLEVVYDISVKKGMSEKNMIDEIRCRNSNLTITIFAQEEEK